MANSDVEGMTALSVALTGFSAYHLQGTGLLKTYTNHLITRMGMTAFKSLISTFDTVSSFSDSSEKDRAMRHLILGDACLGPAARSLLKLWYVGVWHALPSEWHDNFGGSLEDVDCVPCAASYTEGLLWPAIGTNPAGVKAQGYAAWARPPKIPNPHQEN
jgi:hypothetical protein